MTGMETEIVIIESASGTRKAVPTGIVTVSEIGTMMTSGLSTIVTAVVVTSTGIAVTGIGLTGIADRKSVV